MALNIAWPQMVFGRRGLKAGVMGTLLDVSNAELIGRTARIDTTAALADPVRGAVRIHHRVEHRHSLTTTDRAAVSMRPVSRTVDNSSCSFRALPPSAT
ncbi:hypothetical protein ACQPZP_26295 [Spirillospora sp. CA-142024]|uniref:hypothetical protein n=1 Tax=Spirillospora sp. CA-142024 TaxID=3240036 RepID=UPI003D941652